MTPWSPRAAAWLVLAAFGLQIAQPPKHAQAQDCDTATLVRLLTAERPFDYSAHPITLGIEVEGVVPKKLGRAGLARLARKELERANPDIKIELVEIDGSDIYELRYSKGGHDYVFAVDWDPSIRSPAGHTEVELKSPILRTAGDKAEFLGVVEAMRRAGLKPAPLSSGVHVHVGFPEASLVEVLLTTKVFARIEDALMQRFSMHEARAAASRKMADEMPTDVKGLLAVTDSLDAFLAERFDGRHWALNWEALYKFGTAEFRLFNSTVRAEDLSLMADFSGALVQSIRSRRPALMGYLRGTPEKDVSLDGVANAIGVPLAGKEGVFNAIAQDLKTALALRRTNERKATLIVLGVFAVPVALVILAELLGDDSSRQVRGQVPSP